MTALTRHGARLSDVKGGAGRTRPTLSSARQAHRVDALRLPHALLQNTAITWPATRRGLVEVTLRHAARAAIGRGDAAGRRPRGVGPVVRVGTQPSAAAALSAMQQVVWVLT